MPQSWDSLACCSKIVEDQPTVLAQGTPDNRSHLPAIMYHSQSFLQSRGQQKYWPKLQRRGSTQLAGLKAATVARREGFWILPSYSVPWVLALLLRKTHVLQGLHIQLVERSRPLLVQGPGNTFITTQ